MIQNLRQALQVAVNALNGVKGHAQYCDNCKSFEMVNDCLQAHHGFTHELDGPHWDVNSQVERAYKELEAWHSLRDVSTHFVPGNDGMGEEIDPTPASVRDHLKYLQTEWDDAEKRAGEAERLLPLYKAKDYAQAELIALLKNDVKVRDEVIIGLKEADAVCVANIVRLSADALGHVSLKHAQLIANWQWYHWLSPWYVRARGYAEAWLDAEKCLREVANTHGE